PNYFIDRDGSNTLNIYKFHIDWSVPLSSTFSGPTALATAPYNILCASTADCIPQPGTGIRLDPLSAVQSWHGLAYGNFGAHESLVFNHTVDAGSGVAGVRWYEIRSPGSNPSIFQQGTYAPADGVNRWMGSVSMDGSGDMALGYSVS